MIGDVVGHRSVVTAGEFVAQGEGVVGIAVAPHQVLGRVERVRRDHIGVGALGIHRVVPLDHVGAGGLGHDDVPPRPDLGRQGRHVALRRLDEFTHVPRVQPRCAAALGAGGQAALDRRCARTRRRWPGRRRAPCTPRSRWGTQRWRRLPPTAVARRCRCLNHVVKRCFAYGRQQALRCKADRLLHDPPGPRARRPGGPVDHRGRRDRGAAEEVRACQELVGQALLHADPLPLAHRVDPAHQPWEVELPLVRWHVGALHVAELALVALVDDLIPFRIGQRRGVPVVGVDEPEHRGERRAQVEAQPAPVAQVEDAVDLVSERGRVEVLGISGVVRGGHRGRPSYETDSSPCVNRPACDFSALASVSSHSAISSKPSSRAVLANPGYISVYS